MVNMMRTLLVKVKDPDNCHREGFSQIRKIGCNGIDFNRIVVVDKDNDALGFIINPYITFVNVVEVLEQIDNNILFTEKSYDTLNKQFKDVDSCILYNLNPLIRFGTYIQLDKPVRGMRYATDDEQDKCILALLRTLLGIGLTPDELYRFCMENEFFNVYVDYLYRQDNKVEA